MKLCCNSAIANLISKLKREIKHMLCSRGCFTAFELFVEFRSRVLSFPTLHFLKILHAPPGLHFVKFQNERLRENEREREEEKKKRRAREK
jgi:hypothetical protein